ncbi:3-oxoacyl-[acyl-carrier-protein] synthase-3 [Allocatelliglobosispora scoriae]|uniref:3-oxoacyl-[acyl-carrier-protein] synthase-3 n=1 Tax=Allocatelliglobosispora scoriae TaxID=643052 RepID=A0A841C4M4_9ACTN|nr:3-oxoacyl-[acyl-carrier-protein] synthase III C-terminal domain-containing protein [Allocatelliglobosispora scoriae]MBB5874093.1 3-oxoacyl-[acyl-carrier-protein] synthase-3 [Allocatelliglobosispora scoriae]
MTSLESVAVYLPENRVRIGTLREQLGMTVPEMKVFERYFGLAEVPRDEGDLADLLLGAITRLELTPQRAARIRYVVYARSIPVVAPYPANPLHDALARAGLGHAVAFAVTQHACAAGLLAVDLAGRLLAATGDPDARALVLTGEKAFTRGAMLVPRTSVMGEASVACVVRAGGERDRVLTYAVELRGEFDTFRISDEMAAQYREDYPKILGEVIQATIEQAGLRPEEIALILPHNVNTISWERICDLMGFPVERVLLENVPKTGHCFCGDGFLNYRTAVDSGRLRPGDHYLMIGVGTGATFAAMVLQH